MNVLLGRPIHFTTLVSVARSGVLQASNQL